MTAAKYTAPFYSDGTPAQVVISECTIGGGAEAARCADQFSKENVTATLTVTPCWCYGSETMDLHSLMTTCAGVPSE